MPEIRIRPALPEDAEHAVRVLRASITQLCVADHQNDPVTLERWLRNKQPEIFRQWLANPDGCILLAEIEGEICGVGGIRRVDHLDLCYVQPGRDRSGVGRTLLAALEAQAKALGFPQLRLISTASARPFYERQGYRFVGEDRSSGVGLLPDFHYVKLIAGSPR